MVRRNCLSLVGFMINQIERRLVCCGGDGRAQVRLGGRLSISQETLGSFDGAVAVGMQASGAM
jgi:hypothetical protein